MHHIFGGHLRHQVACLSCGAVSKTYESVLSVPLDIGLRTHSLDAALQVWGLHEGAEGCSGWMASRHTAVLVGDTSKRARAALKQTPSFTGAQLAGPTPASCLLLQHYCHKEHLDGDNKYMCDT